MKNGKENIINEIVSLFLTFLLSVFLFIIAIVIATNQILFSEQSMARSLSQSDFHSSAYEDLRLSISDRLIPTGLPSDVMENVITPPDVYQDVNEALAAAFSEQLYNSVNREAITQRLNDNIDLHLAGIDLTREEVGEENIEGIIQVVLDEYESYMAFPFIGQISSLSRTFDGLLFPVLLVSLGAVIVIAGCIYILKKHQSFRYYAYSFGSAALMAIVGPLIFRIWGGYRRLAITPERVFEALVTHIDRTILAFFIGGAIFITVQIICIFISAKIRTKLEPSQ